MSVLGSVGHLYGALQRLRAEMYRRDILKVYHAPCPIISVGNLSAGGTGKTPLVLWLAKQLLSHHPQQHKNSGPLTIVSRGYGASSPKSGANPPGVTIVADSTGLRLTPPQAADEAVLLARNLPGVIILTGPDRARLIRFAIEQYKTRCILMDDGFQHLRVQRDLDLVLVDAQHPFGNGSLLPGGILREYPSALKRCDAMLITRAGDAAMVKRTKALLNQTVPGKPVLYADHQPKAWVRLGSKQQSHHLSILTQTKVLAFCGIARPNSFASLLATIKTHPTNLHIFPDHFGYTKKDLEALIRQARAVDAQALVCTEKDAVKISQAWLTADSGEIPLFFLRMELVFLENPTWLHKQLDLMMVNPPRAALHQST